MSEEELIESLKELKEEGAILGEDEIKILLNLIEKQQKEIENSVSKDKIREKLNYIKSNYSQVNGNYFMMNYQIEILEELLEE